MGFIGLSTTHVLYLYLLLISYTEYKTDVNRNSTTKQDREKKHGEKVSVTLVTITHTL